MTEIDFEKFQSKLPFLLSDLEPGAVLVITRDGKPVAEFRITAKPELKPRLIGLAAGTFEVPPSFFEPLPDDLLAAFNGEGP